MIPMSTAGKNFGKKTFFVSTFLDKYSEFGKTLQNLRNYPTNRIIFYPGRKK